MIAGLALLLIVAAVVGGGVARADEAPDPPGKVAIKVAPDRYEERFAVGGSKRGNIDVFNVGRTPATVRIGVETVRMTGLDGTLTFSQDFDVPGAPELNELLRLSTEGPFTLQPGEARRVTFEVSFPPGAPQGGYFGSVVFRVVPPEQKVTGIAQSARAGTLLILQHGKDVDQRGRIVRADARVRLSSSQQVGVVYENTSSTTDSPLGIAYRPTGSITVKNLFGTTVAKQQVTGELIFPGASREFPVDVSRGFWFGPYRAEVSLSPGPDRPAEVKTFTFWAFSVLGIATVGLVTALLAGLAWRFRHRLRGVFRRRRKR